MVEENIEFYIGQIFEDTYPVDAAKWCKENNAHINLISCENSLKQFQIIENPVLSMVDKQAKFEKDFFETSLGYIRRKVTMQNGETKDFLSDLLPVISIGFSSGQDISIITYSIPDFSETEIVWENYQERKLVTSLFIQECFLRLNNDFQ